MPTDDLLKGLRSSIIVDPSTMYSSTTTYTKIIPAVSAVEKKIDKVLERVDELQNRVNELETKLNIELLKKI